MQNKRSQKISSNIAKKYEMKASKVTKMDNWKTQLF